MVVFVLKSAIHVLPDKPVNLSLKRNVIKSEELFERRGGVERAKRINCVEKKRENIFKPIYWFCQIPSPAFETIFRVAKMYVVDIQRELLVLLTTSIY